MGLFGYNEANNFFLLKWNITCLRIPTGRGWTSWLFYKHSWGFEDGTTENKSNKRSVWDWELPSYKSSALTEWSRCLLYCCYFCPPHHSRDDTLEGLRACNYIIQTGGTLRRTHPAIASLWEGIVVCRPRYRSIKNKIKKAVYAHSWSVVCSP